MRVCGGQRLPTPGHTSLGGRAVLPRRSFVVKEGLRGRVAIKARAHRPGGTGSLAEAVVGAPGGPAGRSSSQGPGTRSGGTGSPAQAVVADKEGLRGAPATKARAHQPRGTGRSAQSVVGALAGPAGGSNCQGPGTSGGKGSPAQAVVVAHGGAAGGTNPRGLGTAVWGGQGVAPRRRSVLKEGLRVAAVPIGPGTRAKGSDRPAQAAVGAKGGPAGPSTPNGLGARAGGAEGHAQPVGFLSAFFFLLTQRLLYVR